MDLVVNSRRMPAPGETIMGHSFLTVPGGKGANQAVAAARLGASVDMIGCVGEDAFGVTLRNRLEAENVSTRGVKALANVESGVALIQVDDAGENAITVVPGANGLVDLNKLPDAVAAIQQADIVLIQLEIPLASVSETIRVAREANVPMILDPAPVPLEKLPDDLYLVDVLSPNQLEAEALTGIAVHDASSAEKAAYVLQKRGAGEVVIKMGAAGAFVLSAEGECCVVPSFPAEVLDTTAAGDAFTAALGIGLARQLSLVEATRLGCAAGSLAVREPGAQDAMPTWNEVQQVLN